MADNNKKNKPLNEVEKCEQEIEMHINEELARLRHGEDSFHEKYKKIAKKKEEQLAQKKDK